MKKVFYIFLILCALFIGMELGVPARDSTSKELDARIDEFEDNIQKPNNEYKPGQDNIRVDPNLTNSLAKTGERAITGIFEYSLGLLESFVRKN